MAALLTRGDRRVYKFETVKRDWRAIDSFIRACSAISRTFRKILDKFQRSL